MRKILIYIIVICSSPLFGQDCNVDSKKDWEKVEIRVLTQRIPPKGYEVTGEWAVKGVPNVGSLDKLEDKHLKEIKKKTAKNGACIVYIDVNGIMNYTRGLYYYWVKEKD